MPNKEMRAAVEEFILQRINICGAHESPGLQTARERFKLCIEKLNQTLSDQQNSLYRECENTYALVDGETMPVSQPPVRNSSPAMKPRWITTLTSSSPSRNGSS